MDKSTPPITFGVFKPVGHTVIAFRDPHDLHAARLHLQTHGFRGPDMVHYSAQEMLGLSNDELHVASPLASFGYEMDLLRVHHRLAEQGCSFLVVHAPSEALQARVADLVQRVKPASAQHYGRLLIRDLTEPAPGSS